MAFYGTSTPNGQAFGAMLDAWRAANPGALHRFGGGPGDVGFGPGVMPSWFGGTPLQQRNVSAVAGNQNLLQGWQSSPIPQWQIEGLYPGGPGWVPGVTPVPPGWQGSTDAPLGDLVGGRRQDPGGVRPPHWVGPAVPRPPVVGGLPSAARGKDVSMLSWKARQRGAHPLQTLAGALSSAGLGPDYRAPGVG